MTFERKLGVFFYILHAAILNHCQILGKFEIELNISALNPQELCLSCQITTFSYQQKTLAH